jgi:shikimate kinase
MPTRCVPLVSGAMAVRAVFLVGFMASGKSTVGRELARRLGWNFVDLDTHIESREQRTVPEIFRTGGEGAFRLAESAALRDLPSILQQDTVVALGGGAFCQSANREFLRAWPTVFLDAPAEELWCRCARDTAERPLRKDLDQFSQLYRDRLPAYRQATLVVGTLNKDFAAICAEIEDALQLTATAEPSASARPSHSRTGESR